MPSHHPSRMPFPGPPHFAPDGRPLYPPQFYQNAFNQAAFARFGMSQPGPQYNRFRYPQGNPMGQMGQPPQPSPFPPQRMAGRMPFQYGMPAASGNMERTPRENDMNSPNQTEQTKQLSPQQAVPVSTSGRSSLQQQQYIIFRRKGTFCDNLNSDGESHIKRTGCSLCLLGIKTAFFGTS